MGAARRTNGKAGRRGACGGFWCMWLSRIPRLVAVLLAAAGFHVFTFFFKLNSVVYCELKV